MKEIVLIKDPLVDITLINHTIILESGISKIDIISPSFNLLNLFFPDQVKISNDMVTN